MFAFRLYPSLLLLAFFLCADAVFADEPDDIVNDIIEAVEGGSAREISAFLAPMWI